MIYLNNILMFSKTEKKHEQHVETILTCLKKQDLLLKIKKCKFHKYQVNFLEFCIRHNKISLNSAKIKSVTK